MPASKSGVLLTVFIVVALSATTIQPASTHSDPTDFRSLPSLKSGLDAALQWLAVNESSTGSYGPADGAFTQYWASAASYALWLNNSRSEKARLTYSWLASQLDNSSSLFWGTYGEPYGEADVPGAILYSFALSSNLNLINTTLTKANLMQFQKSDGGFEGYWNGTQTVTSSVDTDMALLGLINAKGISGQNQASAVHYLLSLQNRDGSFNLTRTTPSAQIYSQGPDPTSITADTLLALKTAGFARSNPSISKALDYLNLAVSSSFGGPGHIYAAATSALALKAFDQADSATATVVYILSQQNSDGGYSDSSRQNSYPHSNALDTGWAAIGMETQTSEETGGGSGQINSPPIADFSFIPDTPTVDIVLHFNAASSRDPDADQLSYRWSFGDGSSAEGVSPTHTYTRSGDFTVTLTVTDSGTNPGPLSDTKSLNILVQPSMIQGTSSLPPSGTSLWIIVASTGAVAVVSVAFFLGRKSAGGRGLSGA